MCSHKSEKRKWTTMLYFITYKTVTIISRSNNSACIVGKLWLFIHRPFMIQPHNVVSLNQTAVRSLTGKVWRYQRVTGSRKSKTGRQHNGQKKKDKQWSTKHYKKVRIEQHKLHKRLGVNSGALEWLEVPALHVVPVVLLLNDTNIIWYGNHVGQRK